MDKVTKKDVKRLGKPQKDYVVSIYMPTVKVAGREKRQNQIGFRNLVNKARDDLRLLGVNDKTIKKQLEPAEQLIVDDDFWRHQNHGLAAFFSPGKSYVFRLPTKFNELCAVSRHYHVKQLIGSAVNGFSCRILAFSPNKIRLFSVNRESIEEVADSGLPKDIDEALGADDNERQTQHHIGGPKSTIFHGHGGAKDLQQIDQQRFIKLLANKMAKQKNPDAPLLLAAVEELTSAFKDTYPGNDLLSEQLHGNFDETPNHELYQKALSLLEPRLESDKRKAVDDYRELSSAQAELTSHQLEDVIAFAYEGRIKTLLIDKSASAWGEVKSGHLKRQESEQLPGLSDLYDLAASQVFGNGGDVYLIEHKELPIGEPVAATLRY